jgi:hypothetical protein
MGTSLLLTAGLATTAYARLSKGRIHFPFKIFFLYFLFWLILF